MTNHARWFSGSHSRTSGGNTKRLLAIARQEVLRHAEIVLNPPDSSDFARQPQAKPAAAGRLCGTTTHGERLRFGAHMTRERRRRAATSAVRARGVPRMRARSSAAILA